MPSKYFLSVTIDNVEFAKEFQYFVTVQYQNEKKRSDLSSNARNPIFTCNSFLFPIQNPHAHINGLVTFTACVVVEENVSPQDRGMSKILGEVSVDLYPMSLQANEDFSAPTRQQLRFIRGKGGKDIPVGRFIVLFKVVSESALQNDTNAFQSAQFNQFNSEALCNFPDYDSSYNFPWRVLTHIRSATNIAVDKKGGGLTPRAYVQVGWSAEESLPSKDQSYRTNIVESTNPFWNNCFLIGSPASGDKKSRRGFIVAVLKDQNSLEDIMTFSIPVESMTPFVYYNLDIEEKAKKCNLVVSFVLEAPTVPNEPLYDIMVTDVVLNPSPKNLTKLGLVLYTQTECPKIQFYKFDKTKESITRLIEFDQETRNRNFSYSVSQIMKLPLKAGSEKKPTFVFTIPQKLVSRDVTIGLVVETSDDPTLDGIPHNIVATTGPLSSDLQGLLIKKTKKKIIINMQILKKPNNPILLIQQCKLLICTHTHEDRGIQQESQLFVSKMISPAKTSKMDKSDRGFGLVLAEEQNFGSKLSANNQIVGRLLKQLDQKNEALKITAGEVIDLRKQMKLMQGQNAILRHQAIQGEQEIRDLVSRQIGDLAVPELRDKIIKLAAMYKNERVRVKQLENAVRTLEPQVINNMQLESTIANLDNKLKALNIKHNESKKELERIGLYKDTIKKQEKVIGKLEKVITDSMKDIKRAREDRLQLQEYRKNGVGPQSHSRNGANEEITRLQKLVAQLQQKNMEPSQNIDQSQMQFRLYKAQQRCSALQQQISNTSKNYAKEMARLKLMVAEKQALLDGFTLDID